MAQSEPPPGDLTYSPSIEYAGQAMPQAAKDKDKDRLPLHKVTAEKKAAWQVRAEQDGHYALSPWVVWLVDAYVAGTLQRATPQVAAPPLEAPKRKRKAAAPKKRRPGRR